MKISKPQKFFKKKSRNKQNHNMFTSFSTYFLIFWLCQIFKKRKSRCYLWIDIFNLVFLGMTARCVAGCAMIPITVLKTRFESGQYNYTKMSSALLDIYVREGFRGLCCGLTPTLVRDAPYSGLYLMFYTQLKQLLSNEHVLKSNPTLATITHFTCGLSAGLLASLVIILNFRAKIKYGIFNFYA